MQKTMTEPNGNGSMYGFILTGFFYLVATFTLQNWASIATIFAGATTGGFAIYKWWRLSKDKTKKDE